MNMNPQEYDYKIPILYESKEEEEEAFDLRVKTVDTANYDNGIAIGIEKTSTHSGKNTGFVKNYKSGNYIKWSQLRKYYAKHLKSNPFKKGDKIRCISDPCSTKQVGDIFTVYNEPRQAHSNVYYKSGYSSNYKNFELAEDIVPFSNQDPDKDWRDPFLKNTASKIEYSGADAILIQSSSSCTTYSALMNYVTQFKNGGFWYSGGKLHFVTASSNSNKLATYTSAKQFLIEWNEKRLL